MHILFVEDNNTVARAFKMMLEMKGHAIDTAATVSEALSRLHAGGYDVLVSDISLPDGTGYDIVEQSDIPAIALSGYTSEAAKEEALNKGFSEYITKPFRMEEILGAMERVTTAADQR